MKYLTFCKMMLIFVINKHEQHLSYDTRITAGSGDELLAYLLDVGILIDFRLDTPAGIFAESDLRALR